MLKKNEKQTLKDNERLTEFLSPQNMLLWHIDYLELKALDKQQM